MTSPSLLERARARNPLPPGTIVVGAGFATAGITILVFLVITARVLGPERYAGLSAMWSITFLIAPGVYFPIEQEVGRALSDRRARGVGGGPVIRRAAAVAGGFAAVLLVASVGFSGPLLDQFFDDEVLLLVGFMVALVGYALQHLSRGSLSGNDRFPSYGIVIAAEGLYRVVGGLALAVAGVETAGPYALVVGLAPLLAVLTVLPRERDLVTPGPDARWSELTRAFGYLLVASVLALAMINVAPLVVSVLAEQTERELVGSVLIGLIIARIPVFMFQAVQASLIPQLAGLAAAGRWTELRHRLLRLLAAVGAVAAAATVVAGAIGPWAIRTFFGAEFELGSTDMAYLAAASGAFMVAMALGQALIALAGYRRVAAGWLAGMVTLFAVAGVPADILFRVERAFLAGTLVAVAVMGVLLVDRLRRGVAPGEIELAWDPAPGG